jgi:hypothetical protein
VSDGSLQGLEWLVVVACGALGFGLVRFLIVAMRARGSGLDLPPAPPDDDAPPTPPR